MTNQTLQMPDGRRIAYRRQAGAGPTVVFLGGFRSDMTGTKAEFLSDWAARHGRGFLRFDYTGHGASSGEFEEGNIGAWAHDAEDAITRLTDGPMVLVGSSMGGWVALLMAPRLSQRIAGLVGIAAAPDFTEDSMWAGLDDTQRRKLELDGKIEVPSDYSVEPYVITRRLIDDGRRHLVLRAPLHLPFPVRLLHGTADSDVDLSVPMRLLDHADGPDIRLTLVKDADHRFSADDNLALIASTLDDLV